MEATLKLRIAEIFTRNKFSKEDSLLLSETMHEIDDRQNEKFLQVKELFLTQKDKVELIEKINDVRLELTDKINDVRSAIYIIGLVQLLAIISSVLAILHFSK